MSKGALVKMSKGALGIARMSHKRAHYLYFLTRIKLT